MQTERSFRQSLAAMIGICLVIMLIAIDATVVGTALPRIVAELRGYELYSWTATAFLMTNAIMIPIAGRLGDLYGRKPFVLAAILLFTLASALCGMAQSMLQLVMARGLQGVGGGMLTGVAFACISDLFPDRLQRVRWQAMLSATFGVSTAIGPALGGWLTEHAGWRSVFYVNLPVALLALPMVWRFLPRIVHHDNADRSIDWLGALLLAVAVGSLLVATEQGQSLGLTSPLFIALLLLALGTGVAFFRHQMHTTAPIIPARLFANPAVRQLSVLGLLTGLTMFVLVFYSPLLLQGGFGLSPKEAGLMVTPLLVSITIGSIINGQLLPHMPRPERLMTGGLALLLIGMLLLSMLGPTAPSAWGMLLFGICGLSLGFQLPNLTLHIQIVVAQHDVGVASALIQTARMLGSMIGASVAAVVVNATFAHQVSRTLAAQQVSDARVLELLDNAQVLVRSEDQAALQGLSRTLDFDFGILIEHARSGLIDGIHHAYLGCSLVILLGIYLSLRLPPFVLRQRAAG